MATMFLISSAHAQGASASSGGDLIGLIAPFAIVIAIFYFLMIRPQQRRMKEHQAMLSGIRRGDVVVTNGGLVGRAVRVREGEKEISVEFAPDVRLRVVREGISSVRKDEDSSDSDSPRKSSDSS